MGLIGTDAICAAQIGEGAAEQTGTLAAPTLAYTPTPFNMTFPGTVSVSPALFEALVTEIVRGLSSQGFTHFYFLNGHGANLPPLRNVVASQASTKICIRSWWEFEPVNVLRRDYYADWEGMHGTPSEVAITQATHRIVEPGLAATPPRKLSMDYIRAQSGDRHGPPDEHRREFPDGRVGSHSALATPDHGTALLAAATAAVAADYLAYVAT
jgi:creatinine amidohydrolase